MKAFNCFRHLFLGLIFGNKFMCRILEGRDQEVFRDLVFGILGSITIISACRQTGINWKRIKITITSIFYHKYIFDAFAVDRTPLCQLL